MDLIYVQLGKQTTLSNVDLNDHHYHNGRPALPEPPFTVFQHEKASLACQ